MNSVPPWQTNTVQVVWIWLHLKALWICHSVCSYKDFFVLFVPCWKGCRWEGSGSLILALFHVSIVYNISTLPNKALFPVLQNNDKSTINKSDDNVFFKDIEISFLRSRECGSGWCVISSCPSRSPLALPMLGFMRKVKPFSDVKSSKALSFLSEFFSFL